MPSIIQFRRGNTSTTSAFTGSQGELFINTDTNQIVVQDGSTAGGFPLALQSTLSSNVATLQNSISSNVAILQNSISSNVAYIQSINNSQNNTIQTAWNTANTALPNTGGTIGGNLVVTGTLNVSNSLVMTSYTESSSSPTISGGTLTLNLAASSVFDVTLNAAISNLTISNPSVSGKVSSFVLVFEYTGSAYTVVWPATVRWPGATAPTLTNTNGKRDIFTFFTFDGGTSYNAFISGQNL